MFWRKYKQNPDKQAKKRFKIALKIGLLLVMVAGSATAMGASDLITSSAKHRMESIWNSTTNMVISTHKISTAMIET